MVNFQAVGASPTGDTTPAVLHSYDAVCSGVWTVVSGNGKVYTNMLSLPTRKHNPGKHLPDSRARPILAILTAADMCGWKGLVQQGGGLRNKFQWTALSNPVARPPFDLLLLGGGVCVVPAAGACCCCCCYSFYIW